MRVLSPFVANWTQKGTAGTRRAPERRTEEAAIRSDLPGVSRRHARIDVGREEITLEDLGSRNGTYPRGERISSRASLANDDEIRLGPVTLTFRLVSPESSTV